MTHTVESLMALVETYADRHHRYLGFANYESGYDFQASKIALRAALTEALAQRETSDFQKWSVLAFRALDDAGRVLMTVEPECSTESDNLSVLTETIKELMYQALTLNGVLSRKDMDRKFHFGKLDSDELLAAQPVAHPDYTLLRQALEALLPHKSNALRWYTPVDAAIDALRARLESV